MTIKLAIQYMSNMVHMADNHLNILMWPLMVESIFSLTCHDAKMGQHTAIPVKPASWVQVSEGSLLPYPYPYPPILLAYICRGMNTLAIHYLK
jgi:hypothetical protein